MRSAVLAALADAQTASRQLAGGDANVPAGSLEEIAHRDDEPLRQQEHVEEQRADRGDAEHAERRPRRLAHQAPPRKSHRVHRLASRSPLRRSSAHDATTVAEAPSGTAIAVEVSATSRVMRTKTSAVS